MTVFRVKAALFPYAEPLHLFRNFLPAESETIAKVLHGLLVSHGVLLGLHLCALACEAKELCIVLVALGASAALLEFRRFVSFEGSSCFSFTASTGQLELNFGSSQEGDSSLKHAGSVNLGGLKESPNAGYHQNTSMGDLLGLPKDSISQFPN